MQRLIWVTPKRVDDLRQLRQLMVHGMVMLLALDDDSNDGGNFALN